MIGNGFYYIGEPELLAGFRFAGIEGSIALTRDETLAAFQQSVEAGIKVLIFSREAAELIRQELVAWQLSLKYPLVVEIPPIESADIQVESLLEVIREAIGIHV